MVENRGGRSNLLITRLFLASLGLSGVSGLVGLSGASDLVGLSGSSGLVDVSGSLGLVDALGPSGLVDMSRSAAIFGVAVVLNVNVR